MLTLMGTDKGQVKVIGGDKSLQGLTHSVTDNEKLKVIYLLLNREKKHSFALFPPNRLETLK